LPPGYTPVAALATQSPINVELPPPHFTKTGESSKTNNTEEIDLSDATVEPVQQPDNPQGNVEPNLKPVDGGFAPPNVLRETDSDDSFGIVDPSEQDQKKILPSLYYEVTLGFLRKENESPILDFHSSER
jgi:hypothetical protein